jgi:hypothetical protein
MSTEDFSNCMTGEYNADAEAVRFIVEAVQKTSVDVLHTLKDNWNTIVTSSALIGWLASKASDQSLVGNFLKDLVPGLADAALDLGVVLAGGLAFGALLLAIEAGISCADRIEK